jgi:tRNA pseudouridine55 synthase
MGRRRRNRSGLPDLEGVLVVDKPSGMTSHDVVSRVRRVAGQHRVGHTGTLDPMATGVLVLCLGRTTRLVQYLQQSPKTYEATATLGIETDSQDADGEVIATSDERVERGRVESVLAGLVGEIEQVPPMVSAIRIDGERLHDKARRGETVEREPRRVTVEALEVTGFEDGPPQAVSFTVTCSPGTYVRTLAHDAGQSLGTGAHLSSLRRTRNAGFAVEEAVTLDDLASADREQLDALLLPPLEALSRTLPTVTVDDLEAITPLLHGGALTGQGIDGPYAVAHAGRLVGVWCDRDGIGRAEVVMMRPEDLDS